MGQLNKKYNELGKNLKKFNKKDLQSCYSPEEIADIALEDVKD